jgi:hypothetical protein
MHTDPSKPASNPEIRYEQTDAQVRPLYQFLFWISVVTLITAGVSWAVLKGLESWRDKASTRATMAEPQGAQQAPAPRLQLREPLDLAAFRHEEAQTLATYGVVDKEKGVYRIPVEQAMKLLLERGLPSVSEAAVPATETKPATAPPPAAPAPTPGARH